LECSKIWIKTGNVFHFENAPSQNGRVFYSFKFPISNGALPEAFPDGHLDASSMQTTFPGTSLVQGN
jgi:hypothetical protein